MIDSAKEIRKGEELNWGNLAAYLGANLSEMAQGEMEVSQFHGGHANLTYLLKFREHEFVLRRPPFGKIAPGAHDMKREYKVLSKLYKVFPRAPRAYLFCDDVSIIGSPFVVVERKTGLVVRTKIPDCFKPFDRVEERVSTAMVKAMAELHTVDIEKAGLTMLGRPEGFLERQLTGWHKRWELVKTGDGKDMDQIYDMLFSTMPKSQVVSIIHNDIKPDNCQFQANDPDNVTAIFDWDMTTLGDPLADVGSTLSYWPESYFDKYDLPVSLSKSFPDKTFILKKYEEFTGFSLERIDWYHAFAYWKGAVIAAQLHHRYVRGQTKDERMKKFGVSVIAMTDIAKKILTKELSFENH